MLKKVSLLTAGIALLAAIFMLMSSNSVQAQASGSLQVDAFTDASSTQLPTGTFLQIQSTSAGTCSPVVAGVMQADLSGILNPNIGAATLTFSANGVDSGSSFTLSLFESSVANIDNINSGANAGMGMTDYVADVSTGNALTTVVVDTSTIGANDTITFPSSTALTTYLMNELSTNGGDDKAVMLIAITECSLGNNFIQFNSLDSGAGQLPAINTETPSAVTLSDTATNTTSYVWVALAALLIAGTTIIVFGRRKQEEVA